MTTVIFSVIHVNRKALKYPVNDTGVERVSFWQVHVTPLE